MATTHRERIAVLEERQAGIDQKLEKMSVSLTHIESTLSKQRGFIAGVVFVISALWALVAAVFKFKMGGQ